MSWVDSDELDGLNASRRYWQRKAEAAEEQLVRIATFLGRDARHAPDDDRCIAGLVIAEIKEQRDHVAELEGHLDRVGWDSNGVADAKADVERLQSWIDIITEGAQWNGFVTAKGSVSVNVHDWHLPNCDGRDGELLDAVKKIWKQRTLEEPT